MTDESHSKLRAYGDTILEFAGPPALSLDLREPLTDRDRERLRGLGLAGQFAVMTAENPHGENPEDLPSEREAQRQAERNERRLSALERALTEANVPFALVDGTAPDGSYREHCVAAAMPQEEALALGRRLGQLALFWFDGRDFWLLPAVVDADPERLPKRE